jgi:uncharacterized protein
MFVDRPEFEAMLKAQLSRFPAVALLGARQVGKTTLARKLARQTDGTIYLDLEKTADLRKLDDAGGYLRAHSDHLIIIDEIHRSPDLFAELRGIIDEGREQGKKVGKFLLLGSASLDLLKQASESLAGRISYLEMAPISPVEAANAGIAQDRLWLRGGFPDSLTAENDGESFFWRQAFIRSYLERDIPLFAPRLPASTIGRLWTMLANGQGTLLNSARLAQGLGVSAPLITRYIDLLVDLLLVRRLPPWSGNLDKRLVRSPKIYITDSGLLHALAEIGTLDNLYGHQLIGPSWEGFVIEALAKAAGPSCTPMFYRTADGSEIDLLLERGGKPFAAIEVKRSSAPKVQHGFHIACDDLQVPHRFVVAPVTESYPIKGNVIVRSLLSATAALQDLLTVKF